MLKLLSIRALLVGLMLIFCGSAFADTAAQFVYADGPGAGWTDTSWSTTTNVLDSHAHSGTNAIAATVGQNGALNLSHASFSSAPYSAISFWINGASGGGQQFSLTLYNNGTPLGSAAIPALTANQWTYISVPLINVGGENTMINGIAIQDRSGSAQAQFYVDDITLVSKNAFVIYSDNLASGWYDGSWSTTSSESATAAAHSGTKSASAVINTGYGGFNLLTNTSFSSAPYDQVSFWINGGSTGGQLLSLQIHYQGNTLGGVNLPPIPANQWTKISVSLASLGSANQTIDSFVLQDVSGSGASLFYVDDITLDNAHTANGSDIMMYDDSIGNGWQDWSWNQSDNFSNSSPVFSGSSSIGVTVSQVGQGLTLHHQYFGTGLYDSVSLMINGGSAGGHSLSLYVQLGDGSFSRVVQLPLLIANAWTHVIVSLNDLGLSNASNIELINITDGSANSTAATFYVDSYSLNARTAPATANISVNASNVVKAVDTRTAGLNIGIGDAQFGTSGESSALALTVPGSLRIPGGSVSDAYHWSTNKVDGSSNVSTYGMAKLAAQIESVGAKSYVTVNYGSGTPEEAAALVAWANGSTSSTVSLGTDVNGKNWKTVGYWASLRAASPLSKDDGLNSIRAGHSASYNWKYFEVGNEVYGPWENDTHGASGSKLTGSAHDAPTYASAAATFITKMKAVDSTIQVGVVGVMGGMAGANGGTPDDFCYNSCIASQAVPSAAGGTHAGWNPIVIYRMSQAGVRPDFLIVHDYPQDPGFESDPILLSDARVIATWSGLFKGQIANYWTGSNGNQIDLAVTEANSVSSNEGKQATNLVNTLYYADFYGQLIRSGFNAMHWWSFPGTESTSGNNSSSLFGSRNYGSYSLVSDGVAPAGVTVPPANSPLPTYRVFKQLAPWRAAGANVVATGSSDPMLEAYANKRSDGKLALLVINKSPSQTISTTLNLTGFTPGSTAVSVTTYGINEDNANSDVTSSSVSSGSAITYSFPPYSTTVLMYSP